VAAVTGSTPDLATCSDCGLPYVREWAALGGIESLRVGDDDREHTDTVVTFGEGHNPCPARQALAVGGTLPSDPRLRQWAEEEQVQIEREARSLTPEERARHAAVCREVWKKFGGDPNGTKQEDNPAEEAQLDGYAAYAASMDDEDRAVAKLRRDRRRWD
jgi:hypothetical protein